MSSHEEGFNRAEAKAVVEYFADKPVTNDILKEFCNLHGYKPIGVETYEDYKFAYEHDKRIDSILPDIMVVLSKVKNPPELASDTERQSVLSGNEALEEEIAFLCEKHGILYQDVDILLGGLASTIKRVVDGAKTRVSNMAANELLKAAEEKFGRPLLIRTLGEHQRAGKKFQTSVEAKDGAKTEEKQG